jgi:hypothetical protein
VVADVGPPGVDRVGLNCLAGRAGQRLANEALAFGDTVRAFGGDNTILLG